MYCIYQKIGEGMSGFSSVLAVGGMVRCHNSQRLTPAGAQIGYCSSSLENIIITSYYTSGWKEAL